MALPKFILFQRELRNLRYRKEEGPIHKFLQYTAITVEDPCAKFEVQQASTWNGQVHLRSCYNNKYLRREAGNSTWIVAAAENPEEDTSIWSCTLFSISPAFTTDQFSLIHVQIGQQVGLSTFPDLPVATGTCLRVTNVVTPFRVVDWETIVFLPKHIAFKGDNGKYLSARIVNGQRLLQFSSEDIEDPTIRFEVVLSNEGFNGFRSDHLGTFWRIGPVSGNTRWIFADSSIRSFPFWPIKLGNFITLSPRERNFFSERFTSAGITDCLSLTASTIGKTARMEVEEVVLSRRVGNVIYRLMDARIYNERALTVATAEAINRTQEPNQVQLNFSYREYTSNTWNNEVSVSARVSAQFRFGIPFLSSGKIGISAEVNADWQWGETRETTTEVQTTYNVTVPPMKIVRVRMLATEASFDVPFSYVQRDTLTDGREVTYEKDGGVFTGLNSYNFRHETEEEELEMSSELRHQELSPKMQGPKSILFLLGLLSKSSCFSCLRISDC